MDAVASFCIGHSSQERLRITIIDQSHPESTDRWDGNWVTARIDAQLGGFRADIPRAQLRRGRRES